MKIFLAVVCCAISLLFSHTASTQVQPADYKERIAVIQQTIPQYFYDQQLKYYKEFWLPGQKETVYSYLWPLCALVQAANETEKAKLATITMKSVLASINDYLDPAPPSPAFGSHIMKLKREDRFYDDNQWIGIACMDAYERTSNKQYLAQGIRTYRFMMSGFDTVSGGGLYWKEGDHSTKNTCSNGPGIILALQLYKATLNKTYLDTALLLYKWTNRHLLSPKGIYYDNIALPSGKVDRSAYTYNTGTMLQSNVLLYEITQQPQYFDEAKRLAEAAYTQFYKNSRWPANAWFNAVLLRGYLALYARFPEKKYIEAFMADGELRWNKERDERGLLGRKNKKELIEQAGMLEIYARLMEYLVNAPGKQNKYSRIKH